MKKPSLSAVGSNWLWVGMVLICLSCGIVAGGQIQQIRPADSLPESTPWDLEALSRAPEFSWDARDKIRSLHYAGETYQGRKTRVFAYYSNPDTLLGKTTKGKRFPAIVLVHGGGGTAFPHWVRLWAERGYAAIAMDLAGCGPDRMRLPDGGPGQGHDMKFEAIDRPVTEQWTYHAVANVIRAHSLIQSLPEVDSKRTAITGISWGGYLTCIVAGLDNRFQAAVPVYGCGFLQENSAWLGDFAKMSSEHQAKWVKLWEPSQYVGSAAMPTLFINGGKDFAYPPNSHAKTFALVQSPKYLHFVPDLPHGHIFDRPKAIEHFIEHQLNGGPPLAQISTPRVKGGRATANVATSKLLIEGSLHYTEGQLSGDARNRRWTTKPAKVEHNTVSVEAPPDSATAWFFTVKDDRDVLVSSPLAIVNGREQPRKNGEFVPNTQMTPYQVLTALGAKLEVGVPKAKRAEYRRIFRMLDADDNKMLSSQEYVDNGRFANRQVRKGIFRASDQDRNGLLEESEYTTNRIVTDEAKRIIESIDADGDGEVTRSEFLANCAIKNDGWVDDVFAALDTNDDEVLQTPEYLRVWGKWARSPKAPPTPHENVKYGPYDRNVLDLWLPDSEKPTPLIVFIHGGGFVGGSKDGAWWSPNVQMALDRGVAFASIQYRFRFEDDDEGMTDPQRTGIQYVLRDSARAIQYMRAHAQEYKLDELRVACFGGSAGAGTSLWLACHDDLADPDNADPVLRESSRIVAAGMLAGQFTYDISRWDIEFKSRGGDILKTHGNGKEKMEFWRFFGLSEQQYNCPEGKKWRADVDMHGLITSDDPPVFAMTAGPDQAPSTQGIYNHHPYHAQLIEQACEANGVEVVCLVPQVRKQDALQLDSNPNIMMDFFFKHLGAVE